MNAKKPSESLIVMTELVLPNDTNLFDNLMGGRLMYWMDIAAALSGSKHCGAPVVTASVDNISLTLMLELKSSQMILLPSTKNKLYFCLNFFLSKDCKTFIV